MNEVWYGMYDMKPHRQLDWYNTPVSAMNPHRQMNQYKTLGQCYEAQTGGLVQHPRSVLWTSDRWTGTAPQVSVLKLGQMDLYNTPGQCIEARTDGLVQHPRSVLWTSDIPPQPGSPSSCHAAVSARLSSPPHVSPPPQTHACPAGPVGQPV